uniref:Sperm associated antigen 17 n=1 Tax=Cyclopterus lumpus TaxID=8103 RepID=A0A8C3A3I6_CYCLU
WNACVSLVVGESPEAEELTQVLSLAVQKPIRKLFNLLTWDSTLAKVFLVWSKCFFCVTEPAKVLLDAGEEIPCDLMAKILKFQLLRIKANDQQRREAEQAEEEKTEAGPPPASKDKGGATVSDKKGKRAHSPVLPTKEKTKLKHRNEFEPPKWIDDEPQDGPQHYILLLGFYQPHLIGALDAIGVHVANVIKLCSGHTQTSEGNQQSRRASLALDAGKGPSLDLFWSGLRAVLDSGPPNSKLHDVVQISYTVPDEMGSCIFEGVAKLIYDCLDWRRQHQHYLHSIQLLSVPTVAWLDPQPAEVHIHIHTYTHSCTQQDQGITYLWHMLVCRPPLSTEVDMRYYCNLLDLVPPEVCSVPLILHCMLEQVCVLCVWMCSVCVVGPRFTMFESGPLSRAVQGFDPAEVELSMMRRSPVWELIQSVARPRDSNSCWMAIKQQLQHYCTDGHVFESMPLTRLGPNGVLQNAPGPLGPLYPAHQQTPTIIPWDNPLSYAKQQRNILHTKGLGKVCCQLDLHDIQSSRLRSLFDWHYTEHHSASIFPQVLQSASEEYRCLDTFRGSHNNILYIFCHNPMSPYRQCKEFWDVTLHTDVKFRKYLEHVADTISDWTKEEELKREAMQLRDLSPAEPPRGSSVACQHKSLAINTLCVCVCVCSCDVKAFAGYSMDGRLIHVSGRCQYVFPSDGGQITVENVSYVEGIATTIVFKITTSICCAHMFFFVFVCPGVSSEEQGMLVKQGFPLHGRGAVGQLQDPSLSKELSRIVNYQGAVIRYMRDGSTEVNNLYTHVMLSREDLVVSVQNPDGSLSVEHADGTRITRLYRDRPPSTPQHILLHTGDQQLVHTHTAIISKHVERVVLVEKEGYPTVVMYPERHTAHVFLADGTVVTGNNQGAYQMFPSSTGLIQIQSDGKCVYSSDPLVTPSPKGCTPTNQPGSYTMSHTDIVACDITDPDGNHFQVRLTGRVGVVSGEDEEEDREMAKINGKHREHCPRITVNIILCSRLFLVHEDGSGTELLSSQTAEELLYQAYADPNIALLKEPLADTQGFSITILKPSHESVWSQWLLGKQNPDITPANLRNRSWHDFPRIEKKSPGPPFGVDMGRGLTLIDRSGASAAQRQPLRSCPKVLEMRELYQRRPFTTPLKNTIDTRLTVKTNPCLWSYGSLSCIRQIFMYFLELLSQHHYEEKNITHIDSAFLTLHNKHNVKKETQLLVFQTLLQHQMPDMRSLSMDLPPLPKSGSPEAFLKDAPQEKSKLLYNIFKGALSLRGSSGQCKSVQVDVTGRPRRTKVRLPTSILGSKPYSVPNEKFLAVDEPVRRKCRTISLTDPSVITRGFLLLPSSVDFGTQQEVTSSAITVVMKNVGVDTCRFYVKQPPPATGLRVIYNPGPVAAGLHVQLQVQLFAMCTVQAGEVELKKYISQDIIIHTETDILYLTTWVHTRRKAPGSVNFLPADQLDVGAAHPHRRPVTLLTSPSANEGQ